MVADQKIDGRAVQVEYAADIEQLETFHLLFFSGSDTKSYAAELAEKRDNDTGLHLRRVSEYSALLAAELQLPLSFVNDLRIFASLHDIGKVGIPDDILLAPRKLTSEEFEVIKTHSTIGYDILKDRPTLEMAADIAYTHHERFDGSGYPRGIVGEAIPISGRDPRPGRCL